MENLQINLYASYINSCNQISLKMAKGENMFSENLTKLRKESGMSQEQLAEELNVTRQAISKWESGTSMPDIDTVIALSEIFNVTTDYLLKGTKDKSKSAVSDEAKLKSTKIITETIFLTSILVFSFINLDICLILKEFGLIEFGVYSWWILCGGSILVFTIKRIIYWITDRKDKKSKDTLYTTNESLSK